ncbi:MAG: T9SS type B sorting domain-containing protein [Bacteroidota bacterium]
MKVFLPATATFKPFSLALILILAMGRPSIAQEPGSHSAIPVDSTCYRKTDPPSIDDFTVSGPRLITAGTLEGRTNILAGDIDNDGEVEILAKDGALFGYGAAVVHVFDGVTGDLENSFPALGGIDTPMAIADVDGDGDMELFFSTDVSVQSLEHTGVERWSVPWPQGDSGQYGIQTLHLIDFNGDGIPEVFGGNTIFNALTGQFLAAATPGGHVGLATMGYVNTNQSIVTAADVLPQDAGPELIAGRTVYTVDITNPDGTVGNIISEAVKLPGLDGHSYPIDVDLDGQLDIVTASNGEIIAWNPRTAQIMASGPGGVGGIFMIGNIDDDPFPEVVSLNRGARLEAYEFDLTGDVLVTKWSIPAQDTTSGWTGASMFDFNGDGIQEIVYRDEGRFRVINGPNGDELYSNAATTSLTRGEYPIIVDIDNDDEAEVIVASNGRALHVYESGANPWQPARKIWNQYAYRVSAVNDDGTIPAVETNSASLINGIPLLNVNNVQVASVDRAPRETIPLADALIDLDGFDCATGTVTYTVGNQGLGVLPADTPIVFYDGDPALAGTREIADVVLEEDLTSGQARQFAFDITDETRLNYVFYAVVNIAPGSPLPLDLDTGGQVQECALGNNQDSISPNCETLCDNFEAMILVEQAGCTDLPSIEIVSTGGQEPYRFYLGDAPLVDPTDTSLYSGQSVYEDLSEGIYYVHVMDAFGCHLDLGTEEIGTIPEPLQITLEDIPFDPCDFEGTIPEIYTTGGVPPYQWSLDNENYSAEIDLSGLTGQGNFTLWVRDDKGCTASTEGAIPIGVDLSAGIESIPNCTIGEDGQLAYSLSVRVADTTLATGLGYALDSTEGSAFQDEPNFQNVGSGEHFIAIRHDNGCLSTETVFILDSIAPLSITVQELEFDPCDFTGKIPEVYTQGGVPPYEWSMDGQNFTTNFDLAKSVESGPFTVWVRDSIGCISSIGGIVEKGVDLQANVETIPTCEIGTDGFLRSTARIIMQNSQLSDEILYALDSSDVSDFVEEPIFEDLAPGEHYVSLLHANGCLKDNLRFTVERITPLEMGLEATTTLNEIKANIEGGTPPYTFYFNDEEMGENNTFDVQREGNQQVRVIDALGCSQVANLEYELVKISIPQYFTPEFSGTNDTWKIKFDGFYPNSITTIYDRYGRVVARLDQEDKWDGTYNGNPIPTGDYWYVVELNHTKDNRKFMGHFTLLR